MARIEKTVFISYRRKDISWALAVYQYLTSQNYDVFFDFTSIPSGDFEQIIVTNIRARAHFILILTPTALDRCNEPGDWLRREIETAVDEKRNIIPIFFDGFNFGLQSVAQMMTGKISAIQRYNGLDIPSGYFMEAMARLSSRYLNVPLNAVIHPVSTEVRKIVEEEQVAAEKALVQKSEDIKELVKPAEEQIEQRPLIDTFYSIQQTFASRFKGVNVRLYATGAGVLLIATFSIYSFWLNYPFEKATATVINSTPMMTGTLTMVSATASPTSTMTSQPPTPTSTSVVLQGNFKIVHYYQNDPQWASEKMGDGAETIGSWGSLLTSLANLLSGYGYNETPLTLNEKLKASGGYQSSFIIPSIIPYIFPNVQYVDLGSYESIPAPLTSIDSYLDVGQPVILQVDWNKQAGIQTHFVLAYGRKGNDYLILDPYRYDGDTPDKEVLLTERYHYNGGTLEQEISAVMWFRYQGQ